MDKNNSFIDDMTKMIIRPNRDIYPIQKLGSSQIIIKTKITNGGDNKNYRYLEMNRNDKILQLKGKKIHMSYYDYIGDQDQQRQKGRQEQKGRSFKTKRANKKKCAIYLHTNSGSRMQGLDLVKLILPFGYSMAIFDYRGSGISDGSYTSMGVHQSQDIEHILLHLNQHEGISEFSLWGRSMGAVTILYYLTKQYYLNNLHHGITIKNIVLDSPFSSMKKLMCDIGTSKINLPQFIFIPFINSIIQKIISKLGIDLLKQLDLPQRIENLQGKKDHLKLIQKVNALFLTSIQDKLVKAYHVQQLHQKYPFINKQLFYFNGEHSQNRSDRLKLKCAQFLCQFKPNNSSVEDKKFLNLQFKKVGNGDRKEVLLAQTKEGGSPKITLKKQIRIKTQENNNYTCQRQPQKISKTHEQSHGKRLLTDNQDRHLLQAQPTIIINNNYNVSVNLYEGQNLRKSQFIPNIDVSSNKMDQSQKSGQYTDRLPQTPFQSKYYIPSVVKAQKKGPYQTTHNNHNIINSYSYPISNIQQQKKSTTNITNTYNNKLNYTSSIHKNQQKVASIYNSLQKIEHVGINNNAYMIGDVSNKPVVDIPLIKFQGVDYNSNNKSKRQFMFIKEKYKIMQKEKEKEKEDYPILQPPLLMPRLSQPPLFQNQEEANINNNNENMANSSSLSMYNSQGTKRFSYQAQKSKISLSQLRKIQKKQHETCNTKTSKIISIKSKPEYLKLQKNNIDQQIKKRQQIKNYTSGNIDIEKKFSFMSHTNHNNGKTMKKSLININKKSDRKNSQTLDDCKSSLIVSKHQKINQRTLKSPQKNTQIVFFMKK